MHCAKVVAWLGFAACCALASGCFHGAKRRPGTAPHNFLLVTTSSLRKDHLSAYMYARPTSVWPATEEERRLARALSLDDLAEQGVMFADASSGSPRTFPAACELLTGTRGAVPFDALEDKPLESEATTLAERFHDAGFKTAAFVAGGSLREARGLDQGFDKFVPRIPDMAVLEQAKQWLQDCEQDPAKPWFVWVHLAGCDPSYDPRGLPPLPGDVPGVLDFARLYSDPKYTGAADGSVAYLARLQKGEAIADETDRARLVDLYDGEVARVAACVRNLTLTLRNFDEQGKRWNDTLFILAGLHGVELGDSGPRAWGNDSLCPSVISTPLFIRHPLSLTGSRVLAEPVGIEDIAPTVCDWFGLPALPKREHSLSGRSLLPLVDTYVEKKFEHRPSFAQLVGAKSSRALRTREFAIVEVTRDAAAQVALFDRSADPAEKHDICASQSDVCAQQRAALEHASFEDVHTP